MQDRNALNARDDSPEDEALGLADIIGRLWRSRWVMLAVMAAFVVIGLVKALYLATYKSEGFFHFGTAIPPGETIRTSSSNEKDSPGIALADYKRFAASYENFERFSEWVREKKLDATDGVDILRVKLASGEAFSVMQPVYPVTKLDAKLLADQPKDVSNKVIGLRIMIEDRSPVKAQQMVIVLGRYVMDTIIYFIYSETVQSARSDIKAKMLFYDNTIIENLARLAEFRRRGEALREIVKRYPESAGVASRQVITVTDENARYLPPVTLLATTEVQEFEAREAILKAKREQVKSALLLEYYDAVMELMRKTCSGEIILRNLENIKDDIFKNKGIENDVIKEVHNSITIANQVATNAYLENSRFIAGPTLPIRSTARPLLILAISLLGGLVCGVLAALARTWWINNRTTIVR